MKNPLFILLVVLVACTKEITNENEAFNYTNYSERVVFTSAAQSRDLVLTDITSSDWKITPVDANWLSVQKLSGNSIGITVTANPDIEREAFVTVEDGDTENRIRVWQDRVRFIDVETQVLLQSPGTNRDISITTNLPGEVTAQVTSMNSWLTASITGSVLTLATDSYISAEGPRTATVSLTGFSDINERVTAILTVTQSTEGVEYSFDIPEFTDSWVYKAMYNGVQIAEICREFISYPGVDPAFLQAIVVYPVGQDGKTLLKKGFVAQVLKMKVPNGYNFPAPTADIHGGSVGWDSEGNCVDAFNPYTNGNLPPVTRVYMRSESFSAAGDDRNSLRATTEPYVVRDQRGDEQELVYPVVKIATQYWLQRSLRTTRFSDGTPIPTNLSNTEWRALWGTATPYSASPACCGPNIIDANSEAARADAEKAGVQYSFPCISNESFNNMTFDQDNNLVNDRISPEGWIVPALKEWQQMLIYIGGLTGQYPPADIGANVARIREYLNADGSWNNVSGQDDENITGLSLRGMGGYYRSGTGAWNTSTAFFVWTRTYDASLPSDNANAPAGIYFNTAGQYAMSMMRSYPIRCIRK